MPQIEVDLLTDQGNNAVIRLPGRTYPGVVMQGDTLAILLENLQEVKALIGAKQSDEASDALDGVIEDIMDVKLRYDKVVQSFYETETADNRHDRSRNASSPAEPE